MLPKPSLMSTRDQNERRTGRYSQENERYHRWLCNLCTFIAPGEQAGNRARRAKTTCVFAVRLLDQPTALPKEQIKQENNILIFYLIRFLAKKLCLQIPSQIYTCRTLQVRSRLFIRSSARGFQLGKQGRVYRPD